VDWPDGGLARRETLTRTGCGRFPPRLAARLPSLVAGCLGWLALGWACAPPEAPPRREPALQAGYLRHQDRDRTFHLVSPSPDPGRRGVETRRGVPLVIAFHGSGGDGLWMAEASGLARLAVKEGFAAVFPDGIDGTWADGRGTTPAERAGIDDVGFVKALVGYLAGRGEVDPDRVYAAGFSNGGMFIQRLLLEWPEGIRAGAAVGGTLPENLQDTSSRGNSRPLLMIHGTSDPVVPWLGGMVRSANGGNVLSVSATIEFWTRRNGLSTPAEVVLLPDRFSDGTTVWHLSFDSGRLQVYEIQGGGHAWPGQEDPPPAAIFGCTCREIAAAEVVWHFFREQG